MASAHSNMDDGLFDVQSMALYNLTRAQDTLDGLSHKEVWKPGDTSFDCMHYLGDDAIEHCAKTLQLRQGDRVLDIGSGFNATGRYLNRHYAVEVTGVELQPEIHAMGETITQHTDQGEMVHALNTNFLTSSSELIADRYIDHIVSFLCILHIPDRQTLFTRAAKALRNDGQIYIEDYYARQPLEPNEIQALKDVVSCSYLPSQEVYISHLKAAGFYEITFEDVSAEWTTFVKARAEEYRTRSDRDASLDTFYSTVARLFGDGNLGGVRIHARKSVMIK